MAGEAARRLAVALAAALAAALAGAAGAGAGPLTVAAYYYAWYEPDQWAKGYVRAQLGSPQPPALGEYDSRDPGTIAAHYAWAQRYGVDVFLLSWWGPGGFEDVTLRDHLLPSPARRGTRLAILYESTKLGLTDGRIVFGDREIATLLADFDYLAATYFRHPGYFRHAGRPLVVLYVSRVFRGRHAEAIARLRDEARARHGLELFLVGDEVDWDIGPAKGRIRLWDAITGYTLYSRTQERADGFLARAETRLQAFRRVAQQARVPLVPGAQPGFNDRGVRPEQGHYVLPHGGALFSRSLALAGRYVDPRLRLLTVTSWNEWHEDSQIEPTGPATTTVIPVAATAGHAYHAYGTGLLERLARFKARWERAFRLRR